MKAKFKVGDKVLPTNKATKYMLTIWPKKNKKHVPLKIIYVSYLHGLNRSAYTFKQLSFSLFSYELKKA